MLGSMGLSGAVCFVFKFNLVVGSLKLAFLCQGKFLPLFVTEGFKMV